MLAILAEADPENKSAQPMEPIRQHNPEQQPFLGFEEQSLMDLMKNTETLG